MKSTPSSILKRCLDLLISAIGLAALSPLLTLLLLFNLAIHGWPPLFTQVRPGLHGKPFRMLKFRTMSNTRGPDGELLPDEDRLTRFGQFLRSTSLDELPELWNVLRGEMSLVGPRPLLMEYLPLYTVEQARRHDVRPGITGLAQVRGRNSLSWDEKFRLDVEYVDRRSLLLDMQILLETVSAVVLRRGISAAGEATMPPFQGSHGN